MPGKILLDVNICLDFLLKRRPFSSSAGIIFQAAEHKKLTAVISAISFDTMFYVLKPALGAHQATQQLNRLTRHTTVGVVDYEVIKKALAAGWYDLEDAIQYFSAVSAGCDAVITRNSDDFTPESIPVLSPEDCILEYLPDHPAKLG